jgi:hypothetical protein
MDPSHENSIYMFDDEGPLQYPSIFSILPNKQYGTLVIHPGQSSFGHIYDSINFAALKI